MSWLDLAYEVLEEFAELQETQREIAEHTIRARIERVYEYDRERSKVRRVVHKVAYNETNAERMRRNRAALRQDPVKLAAHRAKDRDRKRAAKQ